MEFLVTARASVPNVPADELAQLRSTERARGIELLQSGALVRIWRLPGTRTSVQLYDVADPTELHTILSSLPLFPWMEITVQAFAQHPVEADAGR